MAYEAGGFHPAAALTALLGALFIQVGTNFYNDYADFKKGADTPARKGPLRVTQAGLVSANGDPKGNISGVCTGSSVRAVPHRARRVGDSAGWRAVHNSWRALQCWAVSASVFRLGGRVRAGFFSDRWR